MAPGAFFVWLQLLLWLPSWASAGTVVVLQEETPELILAPYLEYLREPETGLTIGEVSSTPQNTMFVPARNPNHGFVDAPYWVRWTLRNPDTVAAIRLLEIKFPFLDHIELYAPRGDGSFEMHRTGRSLPFGTREVQHRNFLFRISIPPGTHTWYARLETESAMFFPMILWNEQAFWSRDHDAQFGLGMYYGIMLIMALFNLFIFISLRDRAYLYYVLFIVSFALYQMTANGLAYEYLWPERVWWNRRSTIVFCCLAVVWGVAFSRTFLGSKIVTPLMDRLLTGIGALALVLAVVSFFARYGPMVKAALGLSTVFVTVVLVTGFLCWRRGQRSARFFLLAWFALMGGVLILVLRNIGLIGANFFVMYAIQFGSILDVMLLSFALADRINELRTGREQALKDVMAQRRRVEQQREAMVRELHDGIGALITNISVLAEKGRQALSRNEGEEDLRIISELARESRTEINSFMQCLDDGARSAAAFKAELRHCGNRMIASHGLDFILDSRGVDTGVQLDPFVWLNVLKIYREALTNVVKHAGATRVEVTFEITRQDLVLIVQDNGQGIPADRERNGQGRGLANMVKRAHSLGGRLHIRCNRGTEVCLEVPLAEQERARD
ncbi:sensor histidine kinase [Desulfolithobacter sp.]